MSSQENARVPLDNDSAPARYPETVTLGASADRDTEFVCGFLGCDARPFNPLIAALPKCLHVPQAAEGWLAEFPKQVVAESRLGRVGADTMLTRMAELMFIEVVRRYLETCRRSRRAGSPACATRSWTGDCVPSRAAGGRLDAGHARARGRIVTDRAGRSLFLNRRHAADAVPDAVANPAGGERLTSSRAKVAAVAAQIGYASEAAFSRAFKRATGQSPARRFSGPGSRVLGSSVLRFSGPSWVGW
jgi:AraC-like DNA-binding protein